MRCSAHFQRPPDRVGAKRPRDTVVTNIPFNEVVADELYLRYLRRYGDFGHSASSTAARRRTSSACTRGPAWGRSSRHSNSLVGWKGSRLGGMPSGRATRRPRGGALSRRRTGWWLLSGEAPRGSAHTATDVLGRPRATGHRESGGGDRGTSDRRPQGADCPGKRFRAMRWGNDGAAAECGGRPASRAKRRGEDCLGVGQRSGFGGPGGVGPCPPPNKGSSTYEPLYHTFLVNTQQKSFAGEVGGALRPMVRIPVFVLW